MVYYMFIAISYPYADIVIKTISKVRTLQSNASLLRLTPQAPPVRTEKLKVIYCCNYYILLILYNLGLLYLYSTFVCTLQV